MPAIVSINIAKPSKITLPGDRTLFSGIAKKPVTGRINLKSDGFQGDGSADRRLHGGLDKAICVYFFDHYLFWEKELSRKLDPGAFGENLSVSGLDENQVHIGDIFRVGEAEIEVGQPRQPCHKLNKVFGRKDMAAKIEITGFSGCYCRVLKRGWVEPGDNFVFVRAGEKMVSLRRANSLIHAGKENLQDIEEVLSLEALTVEWKRLFEARLKKIGGVV